MFDTDGVRCDEHSRCIFKFRSVTTHRNGARAHARDYGYKAWPLHFHDPASYDVEVVASAAGPVITKYCADEASEHAPLLAVGETGTRVDYSWGCRITAIWERQDEHHYYAIVEIERILEIGGQS